MSEVTKKVVHVKLLNHKKAKKSYQIGLLCWKLSLKFINYSALFTGYLFWSQKVWYRLGCKCMTTLLTDTKTVLKVKAQRQRKHWSFIKFFTSIWLLTCKSLICFSIIEVFLDSWSLAFMAVSDVNFTWPLPITRWDVPVLFT